MGLNRAHLSSPKILFRQCLHYFSLSFQASTLHIVPPIALFLARHPLVNKFNLSSTYRFYTAAAATPVALINEMRDRLKVDVILQGICTIQFWHSGIVSGFTFPFLVYMYMYLSCVHNGELQFLFIC